MQTTSALYRQRQEGGVRPHTYQFRASFDKAFDDTVTFFVLDTSVLDGLDILAPSDSNVVQEWDKYDYRDYTNRIVGMEWEREQVVPYSVAQAFANLTLNNYDDFFSYNGGSPLASYMIPKRPIRILAGFDGENLPQFVGLTESAPKVNRGNRTADIEALDFLGYLFDKEIDQVVMLENVRVDEALAHLFEYFGLLPSQYVLEEGFNIIPFLYFEKGRKFGQIVKELVQSDIGTLYMDELGMIRYNNRYKITGDPVRTFDESTIHDYKLSDENDIINYVEVNADVLAVEAEQPIYNLLGGSIALPPGTSEQFVDFQDPITSISTITDYVANSAQDGSGSNVTAQVSITDTDRFSKAAKITFSNTSGQTAYLTTLNILGTPAKVQYQVRVKQFNQASIDQFEEQKVTINNNYIQDEDTATSLALSLINYYKDYNSVIELEVKGDYALQLGDSIEINIDQISDIFTITKITNILRDSRLTQKIKARIFNIPAFFTLDESVLDGTDVLAV